VSELTRCRKTTTEQAREVVLGLFRHRPRVLIGEACLAIGPYWRLVDAEQLLEALAAEGVIRQATPEENRRFDVHSAFVLV
jgi:hypothetical protein